MSHTRVQTNLTGHRQAVRQQDARIFSGRFEFASEATFADRKQGGRTARTRSRITNEIWMKCLLLKENTKRGMENLAKCGGEISAPRSDCLKRRLPEGGNGGVPIEPQGRQRINKPQLAVKPATNEFATNRAAQPFQSELAESSQRGNGTAQQDKEQSAAYAAEAGLPYQRTMTPIPARRRGSPVPGGEGRRSGGDRGRYFGAGRDEKLGRGGRRREDMGGEATVGTKVRGRDDRRAPGGWRLFTRETGRLVAGRTPSG